MAVESVDNNAWVQAIIDQGKANASERNTGELGKEEFLNLLVLQLQYQDPLNPMEDTEFIAQMAQFSALEQMQNMTQAFNSMKAFEMIGKYVVGTLTDNSTGLAQSVEGHVASVVLNGSTTYVVVDGKQVPLEYVTEVSDGYNPLDSSLSQYTSLIGWNVNGAVYDTTTAEIVGVTGDVVSLAKGSYEDYAIVDNASVVISGLNKNGTMSGDRNAIKEYLDKVLASSDKSVEVYVTDSNGKNVPVGAQLRSYEVDENGAVTAVLDQLPIPVTSVTAIKKATAAEAAEAAETVAEEEVEGVDEDDLAEAIAEALAEAKAVESGDGSSESIAAQLDAYLAETNAWWLDDDEDEESANPLDGVNGGDSGALSTDELALLEEALQAAGVAVP